VLPYISSTTAGAYSHWTHLAAQAFGEANRTVDPQTREELHRIANEYLDLACKAHERQNTDGE
jgi:hypothetical protein